MKATTTGFRKSRVFYGWIVLAGTMLVMFIQSGTFLHSFGVILPVWGAEFGWSRGEVAVAMTLGLVSIGLPAPLWGILVSKFGPRICIVMGSLLAAISMIVLSFTHELWQVYILYAFMGLSGGFGNFISCSTVLNNWFIKKRSLALGIYTACGGVGGFVFPPVVTRLISNIGWRESYLILAGIYILLATLLSGLILIRNRPEDKGLLPDAMSPEEYVQINRMENSPNADEKQPNRWLIQVLRIPATWYIGIFTGVNAFILGAMTTHQVSYLQDLDFSAMTAAITMSVLSVFSVLGSVGFGLLALKYNIKHLAIMAFAALLTAMGILLLTKELAMLYIYSAILGVGLGMIMSALPTFVGVYYRREMYAKVLGVTFLYQVIGQSIAPVIVGAFYDATTSYTAAFILTTLITLAGLVCTLLIRAPYKNKMAL